MTRRLAVAIVLGLALGASGRAGELTIGPASAVDLGGTSVDLGCADLRVLGTFGAAAGALGRAGDVAIEPGGTVDGGSGTIELAGDWTRSGVFSPGSGRVRFTDGCGRLSATILGTSTFADLELVSSSAKTFVFESGATTSVTGAFAVSGAPSSLVLVRATIPGSAALLDLQPGATQAVSYVDVQDNHAIGLPVLLDATSTVSGNAAGWIAAAAVPLLGLLGTVALAGLLARTAHRALKRAR